MDDLPLRLLLLALYVGTGVAVAADALDESGEDRTARTVSFYIVAWPYMVLFCIGLQWLACQQGEDDE